MLDIQYRIAELGHGRYGTVPLEVYGLTYRETVRLVLGHRTTGFPLRHHRNAGCAVDREVEMLNVGFGSEINLLLMINCKLTMSCAK